MAGNPPINFTSLQPLQPPPPGASGTEEVQTTVTQQPQQQQTSMIRVHPPAQQQQQPAPGTPVQQIQAAPQQFQQVWSLNQFFSVDFSLSTISVKKCIFNKNTTKVCVSCC